MSESSQRQPRQNGRTNANQTLNHPFLSEDEPPTTTHLSSGNESPNNATTNINRRLSLLQRISRNLQFSSVTGLARIMFGGFGLGVSLTSGIFLFCIGFSVASNDIQSLLIPLSLYIILSSVNYLMEFVWHAIFHPETLDWDAFIVYSHSRAFHIALLVSLVEYVIEWIFFPQMKAFTYPHFFGLILTIIGLAMRQSAMFTAGQSFTHLIATSMTTQHILIQHGIYKYLRHPSYCGWFWFSVGTQILLANPISIIGFAMASWNFFKERIPFEEEYLVRFYGRQYTEYRNRSFIGIPFLSASLKKKTGHSD